jgi:hypothetical protein
MIPFAAGTGFALTVLSLGYHFSTTALTSNVPIGLTAIALGSYLTAYLDRSRFDESVEDFLQSMGLLDPTTADNKHTENTEFYTSFLVLVVTSLWSFILSILVNGPSETPDKKEQ